MGTLIELNGKLPEHLKQYQDDVEEANALITSMGGNRISIRGKQFSFVKDGEVIGKLNVGMPLTVVMLKTDPYDGTAKAFYVDAYKEDVDSAPDCHSSDGVKPDANSEKIQNNVCATCKWNAFGTGTDSSGNPSKGKACADFKYLFVTLNDKLDDEVWAIRVPATSLKALSRYGALLLEKKLPMYAIETELSFNQDVTHPQLEFKPVKFLDAKDTKFCHDRSKSSELTLLLPSKNNIAASEPVPSDLEKPDPNANSKGNGIPTPPKRKKVMTEQANGLSYDDYIKNGWNDQQLVDNGIMEFTQ